MSYPSSHRRRGFTLVEIVVVVSLVGIVLGLSATMLGASFRAQRRTQDREELRRAYGQFAMRLRTDAHSARGVELPDNDSVAEVRLSAADGGSVSYLARLDEVERQVLRGEQVVHRDRFRFPGCQVQWSASGDSGADRSRTIITAKFVPSESHPHSQPAALLSIEAAVGLTAIAEAQAAAEPVAQPEGDE